MSIFFSIIVPVYNSENTIKKTLDSIKKQSLKNIEVLIINDNSIDKSSKIIQKFKKKSNNVKIIDNKKNLGVSVSRNRGLKVSKGNYIIFLDSDDILLKGSLEYLKEKIEKNNNNFYFIKSKDLRKDFIDHNEVYYNKKKKNNFSSHIKSYFHFRPTCWNFICKKDFLIKIKLNFFNIRLYEDQIFASKLINSTKNFAILSKPIYGRVTENPNSLGKTIGKYLGLSCLKCILELIKLIEKNNINLSHPDYEYMISRINFLLQDFNLNIISSNTKDIKKYSEFIFLNQKLFLKIKKYNFNNKIFYFLNTAYFVKKKKEIHKLILNNKNYEIKKIIKKFNQPEKSLNYLFCANQVSKIIGIVCKKNNIQLNGIIDNNRYFKNKFIHQNKIFNEKHLKIKINKGHKTNILICNLEKQLIQSLKNNLPIKKNLNISNIIS